MVTLVGVLLALVVGSWSTLQAQAVRGQVVDSVTHQPLAGVTVRLLDAADESVVAAETDEGGLFLLRATVGRQYRLRAQAAGYRTSTFPEFALGRDELPSYMLLLPSLSAAEAFPDRIARRCSYAEPDTPTIGGWVRHADTRRAAVGAAVVVSWADVPQVLADFMSVSEVSNSVLVDSLGFYAICGIPKGQQIWFHATSDSALSDFQQLTFADGAVAVGSEVFPTSDYLWRHDLVLHPRRQLVTSLAGTVTDAVNGAPVAGATVELLGVSLSTTTDGAGRFSFPNLPAGPVRLAVRQVGRERVVQVLWLPREGALEIPQGMLQLGNATAQLDPVVVATTPGHDPLDEFKHRRELGNGSFITREEFMRQGSPNRATDVLRRMAGIRVLPASGEFGQQWIVTMTRGGPRTLGFARSSFDGEGSGCPPLYFLDRHPIGDANTVEVDGAIPLSDVEAVEAHGSAATLPIEFNRPGAHCGVIAFWTRFADPKTVAKSPPPTEDRSFVQSTGFHFLVATAAVVGFFFGLGKAIHF